MTWSDYQEQAAAHFRRLDLTAETNVTLPGVRSSHDIDVVVRFERAGIAQLWIVECKDTARPVDKSKVLLLRSIIDEVGADRGILLCESGFQSGAREVADRTNVLVTSLAELEIAGREELFAVEVGVVESRLQVAEKAWNALHPRPRKLAGGGFTGRLPVLAPGAWPKGGALALSGRMYELGRAVARARFDDFPVWVAAVDADNATRISRAHFLEAALPVLEHIEAAVASAQPPPI